ncbi:MAG TPA: glycine dehydrogenase, partial [Bacteroidia bacterium]|nr:glycine dehydrogenase [Bacteroidia bacterium]
MSNRPFSARHLGPRPQDVNTMLKSIGVDSLDQLIAETVPASIRLPKALRLPAALKEHEFLRELQSIAAKNQVFKSYIGMGYYDTIVPGVIQRNILENPGWYTAYTPYQAEIAQGRLEALLNFQTMIIDLTGMEIANASLLDEATAAAEAMHMFFASRPKEVAARNANKLFVSQTCLPQTLDVLKTRSEPLGIELVIGDASAFKADPAVFGVILQYPDLNGEVNDYRSLIHAAHAAGIQVALGADLMALALVTPPGEWGADVVYGNTQRFGVPMGFGGPHAAYFASRESYKREMPGRIIGVSIDSHGHRALRMALQTREQHIRRDKATSNICTAQVLLAVMAGMYAVYHGPDGIRAIAQDIHDKTRRFVHEASKLGYTIETRTYFDTVVVHTGKHTDALHRKSEDARINLRRIDGERVGVSIDETTSGEDLHQLLNVFAAVAGKAYAGPNGTVPADV